MSVRTHTAWLLLLLFLLPLGTQARNIAGIDVAERIELDGTPLPLNGAGIRSKFFFDIYVGALYLPQKTHDAGQAIDMPGPKRVSMYFLYKEVARDKLIDGWNEGFENNLDPAQLKTLQASLAAFNRLFVTVRRGDSITLDELPGSGTRVSINGEPKGVVADPAFFPALLRVWLGDEPADDDLKAAMLGG